MACKQIMHLIINDLLIPAWENSFYTENKLNTRIRGHVTKWLITAGNTNR